MPTPGILMEEFFNSDLMLDQNRKINQMEAELSRYSINEIKDDIFKSSEDAASQYTMTDNHPNSVNTLKTESTASSSDDLSAVSTEGNQDMATMGFNNSFVNQLLLENELNNGRIHGHIHSFEKFTYIHGHIHTNEDKNDSTLFTDDASTCIEPLPAHMHHQNDSDSLQFSECHHFEFLNCHDHTQSKEDIVLQDPNLICEEDENCKPKIVEICCDNDHDFILERNNDNESDRKNSNNTAPFIPNLPNCTELHCDDITSPSISVNSSDKLSLSPAYDNRYVFQNTDNNGCYLIDNSNVDSECIDIKCDLDTSCDADELFCKFCEEINVSKDTIDKYLKQEPQEPRIKLENETFDPSSHIHPNHNEYPDHHHHHHHHHKRNRDEENEPLHHHLHHSHQNHSTKHHHHHIQLHDHGNKKFKCEEAENSNNSIKNELINFEWNFKNIESICEWDSCSTTVDNSLQLQSHIFESHLLNNNNNNNNNNDKSSRGGLESLKNNSTVQSKCEWKGCDFESHDIIELVNHINSQHVSLNPQVLTSSRSSSSKSIHEQSQAKPEEDEEEDEQKDQQDQEVTTCSWVHFDGHQCNLRFETAKELTQHLMNDHIGSGKSQYVCNWAGCSRHGKVFNQKQKVIRHLHVHTHYKPFKCAVCKHSFAVESMLEQHIRTHSGEKPFACKICNKKFATSSSLSIHLRTHTGEKPLLCKYPGCGKRFSESSNLTKHMKTHEKEFKCDCCSKSFGKHKQLVNHIAKYHS